MVSNTFVPTSISCVENAAHLLSVYLSSISFMTNVTVVLPFVPVIPTLVRLSPGLPKNHLAARAMAFLISLTIIYGMSTPSYFCCDRYTIAPCEMADFRYSSLKEAPLHTKNVPGTTSLELMVICVGEISLQSSE